jgi:hypothetical protein
MEILCFEINKKLSKKRKPVFKGFKNPFEQEEYGDD